MPSVMACVSDDTWRFSATLRGDLQHLVSRSRTLSTRPRDPIHQFRNSTEVSIAELFTSKTVVVSPRASNASRDCLAKKKCKIYIQKAKHIRHRIFAIRWRGRPWSRAPPRPRPPASNQYRCAFPCSVTTVRFKSDLDCGQFQRWSTVRVIIEHSRSSSPETCSPTLKRQRNSKSILWRPRCRRPRGCSSESTCQRRSRRSRPPVRVTLLYARSRKERDTSESDMCVDIILRQIYLYIK